MDILEVTFDPSGPGVVTPGPRQTQVFVPDPITALVEFDGCRIEVVIGHDPVSLAPAVREVRSITPTSGAVLPSDVVRAMRLPRVIRQVVKQSASRFELVDGKWQAPSVWAGSEPLDQNELDAAMRLRRRGAIPDEEIEFAAEVYRAAVQAGRRSATEAVREALAKRLGSCSRATAGRRIEAARVAGLLGPAVGTKAGEA